MRDVVGDRLGEIDNVTLCRVFDSKVLDGSYMWCYKNGEWIKARVRVMEWKENVFEVVEGVEVGRVCGVWFEGVVNCEFACTEREGKVRRFLKQYTHMDDART